MIPSWINELMGDFESRSVVKASLEAGSVVQWIKLLLGMLVGELV